MSNTQFLLYAPKMAPAGRKLAKAMGIASSKEIPPSKMDVLVRFGSTLTIPFTPAWEINPRKALKAKSRRLDEMKLLIQHGIPTPPILALPGEDVEGPAVIRSTEATFGGESIEVLQAGATRQLGPDEMAVGLIDKVMQYRVHVCGPRRRIRELTPENPDATKQFIWNHKAGFTFNIDKTRTQDERSKLFNLGGEAVDALGLHFGAVDILMTADKEFYVCEVNSAPGQASESTREWYAEHLKQYIKEITF